MSLNMLVQFKASIAIAIFYGAVSTSTLLAIRDTTALVLDPESSAAQYLSCIDQQGVTLISAHRGGIHPGFPENALESMQAAAAYGPMLLEVDVRETADGHLILLHDQTLERTTTGKGNLTDYTLAELSQLRLKDAQGTRTEFSIPTLASILAWADNRAIVQLDVKRGVDISKVARAVVAANAVDSTLMIAYDTEHALAALKVDPNFSFSISVDSMDTLASLENAGIRRDQIIAWTGVVEQPENKFWATLETLKIPDAAGALWAMEDQIIESGNPEPYIELAKAGVDIIAADHYRLAFDTLAKLQDVNTAVLACEGK